MTILGTCLHQGRKHSHREEGHGAHMKKSGRKDTSPFPLFCNFFFGPAIVRCEGTNNYTKIVSLSDPLKPESPGTRSSAVVTITLPSESLTKVLTSW